MDPHGQIARMQMDRPTNTSSAQLRAPVIAIQGSASVTLDSLALHVKEVSNSSKRKVE